MKVIKHLHIVCRNILKNAFAGLLALLMLSLSAHADDNSVFYDSSMQRSNFISIKPQYENRLEKEIDNRRAVLLWKLRFDSENLSTASNAQSQNVGATVRTKFNYKLLDNLKFKAKANLGLESGRSQSIFGDLEPQSGIYPRELKLEFEPFKDNLNISFGQIHQRWLNNSLFIGNLGFPGISEKIGFKSKYIDMSFVGQQLVPTSSTLSTRVGEREELPSLFTETLEGTVRLSSHNFLTGMVTHFKYDNLPAIVAFDSAIYGNSVTDPNPISGQFDYNFEGFITSLGFEQKFTNNLSAQVQWKTIKNNEAPSDAGEAQSISGWLADDIGRWIFIWKYTNYFIESDAVPASYNSHRLGHNNRIGNSIELNVESKDWGIIFKGSYTKADLLNPSSVRTFDGLQQDNQQTIYFAVETMYDFI